MFSLARLLNKQPNSHQGLHRGPGPGPGLGPGCHLQSSARFRHHNWALYSLFLARRSTWRTCRRGM